VLVPVPVVVEPVVVEPVVEPVVDDPVVVDAVVVEAGADELPAFLLEPFDDGVFVTFLTEVLVGALFVVLGFGAELCP
jgi:hypothetical protein